MACVLAVSSTSSCTWPVYWLLVALVAVHGLCIGCTWLYMAIYGLCIGCSSSLVAVPGLCIGCSSSLVAVHGLCIGCQ